MRSSHDEQNQLYLEPTLFNVLDHAHLGRHDVQLFAGVLTDLSHRAFTSKLRIGFRKVVHHTSARRISW